MILYGISNCDTVRKTRRWLNEHGIEFEFHDFKKAGIDAARLRRWCDALGYETLLNKRGTTWRQLADDNKRDLTRDTAIALMQANPSVIKRPVLETGDDIMVGFDQSRYESLL